MTLRRLLFLASTSLAAIPINAQSAPDAENMAAPPPEPTFEEATGEDDAPIVITGGRLRGSAVGDIPAQNILDSRDVRATGATSITELLDALAPQIGSAQGRGGERPVLLLNGQRISGFRELRDIPTEAIERVEILPEEVGLKFGYSASQKVVNIILRGRFRSTAVQAGIKQATDGGFTAGEGEITQLMIGRDGRTMVNIRAEGNGKLFEAERDIVGTSEDDQQARTLLGDKRTLRASGTVNRTIFGDVSATLNAEAEHSDGRSLLGLGTATLDALGRDTRSDSLHTGFALNGDKAKWHWSVTGNGDIDWSRTGTDRDGPQFTRDRSRETTTSGDITGVASGPVLKLPAGDAGLTVRLGSNSIGLDGKRESLGTSSDNARSRTQGNAALNVDLPISRRKRDFSALGNLTINANAEVQQLSDFGTLTTIGAGANWSPIERLNLLTSWSSEEGAPTIHQLGSPILETRDSRIFDFVTGQTVLATVITGGNLALDADSRKVWKLAANWQPLKGEDLKLRGEYVRSVIDRPIQSVFGPTPTLEAAFPDRFVRDSAGLLLSADLRPLNFVQARRDTLRIGFDFSKPLKSARPSQSVMDQIRAQFRSARGNRQSGDKPAPESALPLGNTPPPDNVPPPDGPSHDGRFGGGGGGRGGGGFFGGGGNRGRLSFSLTDTITMRDTVSIGPGLPVIDYLGGDAAGASGGASRHRVETQGGWSNNGFGARLSANWRSGTKVDNLTAGTLRFSPLATFDLRLFANPGERPEWVLKHPWLRGSSVRFEVSNIFNERPKVRDGFRAVPLNYQADLLDPLGRTAMISFRKLFSPNFASRRRELGREAH
ncbi:MAG: TonB-dependent receptor [Sphingomicrobium sp.]